jgi:hypothetical protein
VVFVSLFAASMEVTGVMTGSGRFPTLYEPVAYAAIIRVLQQIFIKT